MAVSILNENAALDATEFTPFDDSSKARESQMATSLILTKSSSIDTSTYDRFRQGIELSTDLYVVKGVGSKIWAGNINGYTKVQTYGQTLPFTEYFNSSSFVDKAKLSAETYVQQGSTYPRPIWLNDGPQQGEEAILMPLTIPFRRDTGNDRGLRNAYSVKGALEDGSPAIGQINQRTSRTKQFIEFRTTNKVEPFIDTGYDQVNTITGSLLVDGFVNFVSRSIEPFDDRSNQIFIQELTTGSVQFASAVNELTGFNLDSDIREGREHRSATAGWNVYGPNQGKTGTDSLTYLNLFRGS